MVRPWIGTTLDALFFASFSSEHRPASNTLINLQHAHERAAEDEDADFDRTLAERLRPRLTEDEKAALKAQKEEEKKALALLELKAPKAPTPDLRALVIAGICKPSKDCLCVRWKCVLSPPCLPPCATWTVGCAPTVRRAAEVASFGVASLVALSDHRDVRARASFSIFPLHLPLASLRSRTPLLTTAVMKPVTTIAVRCPVRPSAGTKRPGRTSCSTARSSSAESATRRCRPSRKKRTTYSGRSAATPRALPTTAGGAADASGPSHAFPARCTRPAHLRRHTPEGKRRPVWMCLSPDICLPRSLLNGSTVFYLVRAPSDWVVITQLRDQLYAVEAQQEAEMAARAVADAVEHGAWALSNQIATSPCGVG